uniref:RNA-directed DNA polymerase, eukaryota n=1 Tax=Tanacetum cinerariifolium TaxID=118510 RepID=A0A6L2NU54_TANCI|nr:hypothetical protein [Tanacetum cinerariifolium]
MLYTAPTQVDLISHCKIRVGNGMSTSFWHDQWLGDSCLRLSYPRIFALENNKVCTVAAKMSASFVSSLRRDVRGGEESAQLSLISDLLDTVVLSNMGDRRFWDLNGDGCFRVKDVRRMLDDMLLPKSDVPSNGSSRSPSRLMFWRGRSLWIIFLLGLICISVEFRFPLFLVLFAVRPSRIWITCCFVATWQKILLGLFVIGGAWFGTLLIHTDLGYLGLI